MYSDYHVHSLFSFDSEELPENNIKKAISLGMKQICFTEHQDHLWPITNENPLIDFKRYNTTLSELKEKYKNKIEILKGVELGLTPNNYVQNETLMKEQSFDFVIGSCHIVDEMDPYDSAFWQYHKDKDREAFESYFRTTLEALRCFSNISALGHMDYIVRYSPNKDSNYSTFDYMDFIDEILRLLIEKNICLEINTANYAKGFDFANPHPNILKRYKELGGTMVTIGSDAHKANDIGRYFGKAEELVNAMGFQVYCK